MDTSQMTRHVGKLVNTDQRVVIAYMQLPAPKQDHALVIPVDNLPARFEQAVMDVLKTNEGQQSMPFAEVLHRRRLPDTGETILEALHRQGKLVPIPVHNILMLPKPNMPIPLADILAQQGSLATPIQHQVSSQFETEKFNPHLSNQNAESAEKKRAIARNLLREAEEFENIAKQKRAQAYAADPTMAVTEAQEAPLQISPWANTMDPAPVHEVFPIFNKQEETPAPQPTEPSVADRVAQMESRFERMEKMLSNMTAPEDEVKETKKSHPKKKLTEETNTESHEG